ncbi:MAG: autotransporter outer membrane beta-barrel domain-containing protein [Gammaproteobacteria bacterium]|nr:autotransporter outer membrane beta-barrel domain-containing protein [Gammaproteobacteria bacterium]
MSLRARNSLGFQFLAFIFFVLGHIHTAHATYPDVVGTFSGTLQGKFLSPVTPTSQAVTVIINQQTNNSFTGSISVSPLNASTTFTGTFLSQTQLDFVCVGSATIAAGPCFTATFDGASLIIPAAGQLGSMVLDLVGTPNDIELGGILSFAGAQIIKPEIAPGTTLKDAGTIQTEVKSTADPVHNHLRKTLHGDARGQSLNENGFLYEQEAGLNAGDWQIANLGVWLSYNYTETENDFFRTAFESDRHTVVGGIDISPNERIVTGLAVAWEYSDTETAFNRGNLESDGFTIAPYFGALLSDTWSLDASFGLSFVDNEQFRTDPTTAARVTSDPDTDRFYFSANLNGITYLDNWILGGRLGALFARSKTERFTESNGTIVGERVTRLGQLRFGGDVAYNYGNWEPYVSGIYEYDFHFDEIELTAGAQPDNDRDDLYLSTGLRFYGQDGLSANLEYAKRLLREDFNEDSFTLTVRYDF